jgi:hypothetical protein
VSAILNLQPYTALALRTERPLPVVRGDAAFTPAAIGVLIAAGKLADQLKRRLVYRRPISEIEFLDALKEIVTACYEAEDTCVDTEEVELGYHPRLLHAALGGFGEKAELLEALQKGAEGVLDTTNVIEEAGDGLWYQALELEAVHELTGHGAEVVAQCNIAKLEARAAVGGIGNPAARDLAAERALLQGRA